jgi:hypothetical protein
MAARERPTCDWFVRELSGQRGLFSRADYSLLRRGDGGGSSGIARGRGILADRPPYATMREALTIGQNLPRMLQSAAA